MTSTPQAKVITLKYPVKFTAEGAEPRLIEKITLSPIQGKHLKGIAMGKITYDDLLLLAGRIADQSTAVLSELYVEDVLKVVEAVSDFLAPGQSIGQ
jgi:hypothetical protein